LSVLILVNAGYTDIAVSIHVHIHPPLIKQKRHFGYLKNIGQTVKKQQAEAWIVMLPPVSAACA